MPDCAFYPDHDRDRDPDRDRDRYSDRDRDHDSDHDSDRDRDHNISKPVRKNAAFIIFGSLGGRN